MCFGSRAVDKVLWLKSPGDYCGRMLSTIDDTTLRIVYGVPGLDGQLGPRLKFILIEGT